jgi:hypothetical protein
LHFILNQLGIRQVPNEDIKFSTYPFKYVAANGRESDYYTNWLNGMSGNKITSSKVEEQTRQKKEKRTTKIIHTR